MEQYNYHILDDRKMITEYLILDIQVKKLSLLKNELIRTIIATQ